MARFDLPAEQLAAYSPPPSEPADFDEFWNRTLADARAAGSEPVFSRDATSLTGCRVFDVRFSGFGGEPVAGWLLLPPGSGPFPTIVHYLGYGGGRGLPHEHLTWVTAGYGCLVMDSRGQGAGWGVGGDTADPHGSGPAGSGVMTRGIESPFSYYYRRLFTDAVRAIDAAAFHPQIDGSRIIVAGGSQGGGIALAAAGLSDRVAAALVDVPFLCDFPRAVGLTDRDPYAEVVRYLSVRRQTAETVFRTLSYFDGVAFARRAEASALFSVALLDQTCPPSTVYAAYNAYGGATKDIIVYPFNDHEGGGAAQWLRQVAFLETLDPTDPASPSALTRDGERRSLRPIMGS